MWRYRNTLQMPSGGWRSCRGKTKQEGGDGYARSDKGAYLDDADMKDLFNRVIGKMPYSQHQMHYRTEIIDTGNHL